MAKLSKKFNNNEQTTNTPETSKLGQLTSKKVVNSESDNSERNIQAEDTKQKIDTNDLVSGIVQNLNFNFDINIIKQLIAENKTDEIIPFLRNKIISETFKQELQNNINSLAEQISQLESKNNELEQTKTKLDTYISNLKEQLDDAEENVFRIEKKFQDSVSFDELSNFFIKGKINNRYTQKIAELLKEAYLKGESNSQKFVFAFFKAFIFIEEALMSIGSEELENLKILHLATQKLMINIKNMFSSERRLILDVVAEMLSDKFENYSFLSAEQSLQIDPAIHNVEGVGGMTIKQGLSFAVIRKDTQKTVYFADVETR